MGYHNAGFDVTGVDSEPQPRYPFKFIQADAFQFVAMHGHEFDVIHASPPCQRYSRISRVSGRQEKHPDLVARTRETLQYSGKPYIIENVPGAPLTNYVMLCGTMFGLHVLRHRLFECNPMILMSPYSCNHWSRSINGGRNGDQEHPEGKFITVTGSVHPIRMAESAMGIDWMTRSELTQAIPPAYTEWLGGEMRRITGL